MLNPQSKRKQNGINAENFIAKWFKAKPSKYPEYDLETKKYLIEVKSCVALNSVDKRRNSYQLGRFVINTDNHILLFLRSIQQNKIPCYVFVLKLGTRLIFKKVKYCDIKILNKKYNAISWGDIFFPEIKNIPTSK